MTAILVCCLVHGLLWLEPAGAAFVHPGLLHTQADLDRIKEKVQLGEEPWKSGFEVFKASRQSQSDWTLRGPAEEIGRNPNVNFSQFDQDAGAAYQCALMGWITGDAAYTNKAKQIVNAWSSTIKRVTGRDAVLMAGLGPFKMVNAAEILRYTNTGWSEAQIQQCEQMLLGAIYPAIRDFAPYANGNWDLAALQTVMAIGVFCNDRTIFENGLRYYAAGSGDGRLTHYLINEAGQCQESGRDQQHTQLGIGLLSTCCEIAWNQGLDLYGLEDNRLLAGFEYTARYNLGEDVPFAETLDRTGYYHHTRISANGRGRLRPIYEQVYNHYANRVSIASPYTQRAAERIRPEATGSNADHIGFGTLLFSRRPSSSLDSASMVPPAAPGVITAQGSASHIAIRWVPCTGATAYTVKRATVSDGPYATIAGGIKSATYTDPNVTQGKMYYYTVCASNAAGQGPDGAARAMCAGLPQPWSAQDVGSVAVAGATGFDARAFTLDAAGTDIGGGADQFRFAYVPMAADCTIVARIMAQVNSQFSKLGLMIRTGPGTDAVHVSLLVTPAPAGGGESSGWYARMVSRSSTGGDTLQGVGTRLGRPYSTYGRLTGPCWLRLERRAEAFTGSISPDGQVWTRVATATMATRGSLLAGLAACSCLTTVTTTVTFDNVSVSPLDAATAARAE